MVPNFLILDSLKDDLSFPHHNARKVCHCLNLQSLLQSTHMGSRSMRTRDGLGDGVPPACERGVYAFPTNLLHHNHNFIKSHYAYDDGFVTAIGSAIRPQTYLIHQERQCIHQIMLHLSRENVMLAKVISVSDSDWLHFIMFGVVFVFAKLNSAEVIVTIVECGFVSTLFL